MPEWKCTVKKKNGKKESLRWVQGSQINEQQLREHFANVEPEMELLKAERTDEVPAAVPVQ